ncbi:MAG: hypothetical protein HN394_03500 [Rhodospirillaceae bacterium]|jgi:hypothetical protein|nr:hypothetical protein [Rhodospirillaceae bacterium]MBT4688134.1 hypothetical protein [Rhodospirillaceae bacterium]MBT5080301.1 hypothetical protein [Rhodospirillaceae bacterium]MBT5881023.1 hypothetical protein [Rhodospirillaceae bacterium]MBT6590443.1 hypothetical protein [Rhodospirillaceae bacterium]
MKTAAAILTLFLSFTAPFVMQNTLAESRYGSWQPPQQTGGQNAGAKTELLKELRALIRDAEKARAADPRFLRDLRALVRRHGNPWPVALIFDDFADGDFTANPVWKVATGHFRVRRDGGLFSTTDYAERSRQSERKLKSKDIAAQIIGQLLTGGQNQTDQQTDRNGNRYDSGDNSGPGEIFLKQPISNAFSLKAQFAGRDGAGFELGVYQGWQRTTGYRLIYTPDDGLLLLRIGRRGADVVERAKPGTHLLDGGKHRLVWQRRKDGRMSVRVDGAKLFEAADQGFSDPFDGFHMFNRGGDMTLYTISVDGTR